MATWCIQSNYVWLNACLQPAWIAIKDGKIVQVAAGQREHVDEDFGDLLVLPGLIDAHTHGNNGVDTLTADARAMGRWQREIASDGVTAFAATTATAPFEDNLAALDRLSQSVGASAEETPGAEVLGIYIEGNFIDKAHPGAQDVQSIVAPSVCELDRYIEASHGTVIRMILAVEHDPDHHVLDHAVAHGIGVSVGHSGATYNQVVEAYARGLDGVTHTYNGMDRLHHREPGIVGAAFDIPGLFAEVIADGHHVSWPAVRTLARLKDDGHLVLVSDASPLKGFAGTLPAGIHVDAEGQFRTEAGALASSSMRMCDGLRNLVLRAGIPLKQAVQAATVNPALMLRCADRKGTLSVGKDADIVVLDHGLNVIQTYCRGIAML